MDNYEVISKGAYTRPQTKDFAAVTSFIFIRQDGRKYLLLKLKNPRAEQAEEINLKITLLDRKERELCVLRLSSDKVCAANSSFAFGEKIEVPEECCDFAAKVESAVYGGYVYRNVSGGAVAECPAEQAEKFDVNTVRAAMRGKTRTVTRKRFGVPVTVCVLVCLLLVCAVLLTYFQLKEFMQNATGFTYSGVEYEFEDGDKTAGSNIIVTGYRGSKPNVVIPGKIDGYVVSEISADAFKGNGKIKRLKIEGDVKVGEYAFAECGRLSSVEIAGGGEITLGAHAFRDCPRLESVNIAKKITYPEDAAVFGGDAAIKELYLENFGGKKITDLFGGVVSRELSMTNLTVRYLDGIYDSFCYGLYGLESVEISYIEGESYPVGDYAFYGTALKTLKIPQGLNSVGAYAFAGTQLSYFNAYGVESIGEYAFSDCENLTAFTVPESLTALNRGTFTGCTSLASVTFENGDNFESVGDYAFSRCESLTDIEIPDGAEYLGYRIFAGCENLVSATLPYIGHDADNADTLDYLSDGVKLKSLTLTSAKSLAARAFYQCETLKEINLNDGLNHIGDLAFYGCTALKSIVIPASVSGAGYGIFESCYRLFEVYNLSSQEIHCGYALAEYSSLEQSVRKSESGGYTAALSDGSFAQPAGWYLIDYPEEQNLSLPQSFPGAANYSVIDYLFYREDIVSVTIPDAVAGIGGYAFYGCNLLAEAVLAEDAPVSEIKERAFYGCTSLSSIALPVAVTTVGAGAFDGCSALESVKLYDAVTKIGNDAFSCCMRLTEAEIPNTDAVSVGERAFFNCSALKSVKIYGGVTGIGDYAFNGDTSLESAYIYSADGVIGESAFLGCEKLCEIIIPDGVTAIGAYAFADCGLLNKVTLPASLAGIGESAFYGCGRLRAVINYSDLNIANDENYGGVGKSAAFIIRDFYSAQQLAYTEAGGVTYLHLYGDWVAVWCGDSVTSLKLNGAAGNITSLKVAPYAFTDNTKITSADLSGASSVGENAFGGCTSLKQVIFSKELTELGYNAFARCVKLTSANLQDTGLIRMGEGAFLNCLALNYASLPSTLEQIPARAFYFCSSLADAVIPQSVVSVGDEAFYGCTSLLQVHNLSYLSLREGSSAFGYCAFYALHVFGDAQSKMTFAETNGYKFANYGNTWYLYKCTNYQTFKKLPESFVFENSAVNSYTLREGAFSANANLIIPASVAAIQPNAIISPYAIYYCGTPAQWAALRPANLSGAAAYYYSECIHSDGGMLWTYNASGYPSTLQTSLVWTETEKPTCTADGLRTGVCPECGKTQTETVEKLYHSAGADGKCARCGAQGEYVQALNVRNEKYSVTYRYFDGNGTFVSSNTAPGSYAELTLTAEEDMQIFFGCYTTSSFYDVLTITAAGNVVEDVSSSYLQEFDIALSKGQKLTFTYNKGYSYGSGGATITYILIFA